MRLSRDKVQALGLTIVQPVCNVEENDTAEVMCCTGEAGKQGKGANSILGGQVGQAVKTGIA